MNSDIRALLFDLGGVLVDWDGTTPLQRLTDGRLSAEQARLFWLESPWVRRFETGRCTPAEFAAGAIAELGLTLDPDAFLAEFLTWDRGPVPAAFALLDELRPHYRLYCLTNNNELHWKQGELPRIVRCFEKTFASFEIGLMKPDPAVFEYVAARIPEPRRNVLFLDDNPECIHAAREVGFLAEQAIGLEGVRAVVPIPPRTGLLES